MLGSTGSIGLQTFEVMSWLSNMKVIGLGSFCNWKTLLSQARKHSAEVVAIYHEESAQQAIRNKASLGLESLHVLSGQQGMCELARLSDVDIVVHAIPGFAGISPLIAGLEKGKRVALAGKEALVSAGDLVTSYLGARRDQLIPVDSEHSAIFQCLHGQNKKDVDHIILTASGGAFRDLSSREMQNISPARALEHPTWKMGPKITVDSATLFNKALEVIEAYHLFKMPYDKIKVVIHRQSIVHSMVGFKDGSILAQLSEPDMRLAISYALTYPERCQGVIPPLGFDPCTLTFEQPDYERFPCLKLGYMAGEMGGTAPCVLSYADEMLVDAFLKGKILFTDIYRILAGLLETYVPKKVTGLDILEEEISWARAKIKGILANWEADWEKGD